MLGASQTHLLNKTHQNDTSINTGLCTDSTWKDPACFLQCLDVDRDHKLSTLYRCNHNHWCCSPARNSTTCCNDPDVSLFQGTGTAKVQNGTAFVAGYSIAPIASITTDSSSSSSSSSSSDHKAVAARVGAGLGIGLPLLAVIGVLSFLLFRERKYHNATKQSLPENQNQNQNQNQNPRYTDQTPLSPHSQMVAALMQQQQQQQNYQIPPLQPQMSPFIPPAYAPPQIPAPTMTSPSTTLFPSEADSSPAPHNVEADCRGTSVSSRPELPG